MAGGGPATAGRRRAASLRLRLRARGRLVAVVAPQVLLRAFADQLLERAIQMAHIALALLRRRKRTDDDVVPRAARQALRMHEEAGDVGAAGELRREGCGIGEPAEELRPFALACAG